MDYILSDIDTWQKLKPLARENRMKQTRSEKIIWNSIRNKQLGYKIRRQHVVNKFIVDFICIEKKLIIEIDGETHIGKEEYDSNRENILKELGFRVLRFTNEEVEGNGNKVIIKIKNALDEI